jgi:carboxyl-terminal processing protease
MLYSITLGSYFIRLVAMFAISFSVFASNDDSNKMESKYWQTRGYGYLIEVFNDRVTFFDMTQQTCVRNNSVSSEYKDSSAASWITIDESGSASLDWHALHPVELIPLATLPSLCSPENIKRNNPIDNFEVFWWTYAENFPYSEKQNWNWQNKHPIWRSKISEKSNEDDLSDIFEKIINQLRDGHASMINAKHNDVIDVEARLLSYEYRLRQAWKKDDDYEYFWPYVRDHFRAWERILKNNYAIENTIESHYENFHFFKLKSNISYLRIDGMMGFTEDDSFESLLTAVDDTMKRQIPKINQSNGLIIDLRGNGGGTDLVSLQLLSYLFTKETRIGSKATVLNGKLDNAKDIWVFPSKHSHYSGPIIVLTSQATASAAEIMLIGLSARSDTIVIGEPSNGSFSDILPKQLPNGWVFGLSHQVYLDVNGNDHEEVGIPVSEYVPFLLSKHLEENKDAALDKAIELLSIGLELTNFSVRFKDD